jgi:predicted HTH transcriptional regulator
MHEHSLAAYREERKNLLTRGQLVLEWLRSHPKSTDRQIMEGLGFRDMNQVRPRCTELVEKGLLVEVGELRCPVTGKTVRILDLSMDERGRA